MSNSSRFVMPNQFAVDGTGLPYAGGQLFFYVTNSTTPQDTYQNPGLTVANTNPVVADENGLFGNIFLGDTAYKVQLYSAPPPGSPSSTPSAPQGTQIWSMDPVAAPTASTLDYIAPFSGAVSRSVASKLNEIPSVLDAGADPTGGVDSTTAFQDVINYAGSGGGGVILVPVGTYLINGTLSFKSNGVTMAGVSEYGCVLNFANGSADGIVVGYNTGFVSGVTIKNLSLIGVGKTAGIILDCKAISNCQFEGLSINGAFNGIYVEKLNNVLFRDILVILTVVGGTFAMKWHSIATAPETSNVLIIDNMTLQCSGTGADGFDIDGGCETLRATGLGIIHANTGLTIRNTQGSNTFYPQFLFFYDLEIDGVDSNAMTINGGRQMVFFKGDFFNNYSGGGADNDCVQIMKDATASITSAIQFFGCRFAGAQHNGVICEADFVDFVACYIGDNGLAASNAYDGLVLSGSGSNGPATSVKVVGGTIGSEFGDIGQMRYGLTIGAGVSRVSVSAVDFSTCLTAAIVDNSGGFGNSMWKGCINIDGEPLADKLQQIAGDPSTLIEGMMWENVNSFAVKTYLNGATKTFTVT